MTVPPLLVTLLAVSACSLLLQATALTHLLRQRASYRAERLAGGGMVRAAATRTSLACVYTASAALALAGVRIPGGGVLGPEALVILVIAQIVWLSNALMDIRIRHRLRPSADHPDDIHDRIERRKNPGDCGNSPGARPIC